jgi:hypothetical protein
MPMLVEIPLTGVYWCRRGGLNTRPHPYQGCALPLSYCGSKMAANLPHGSAGCNYLITEMPVE